MKHFIKAALIAMGMVPVWSPSLSAQARPAPRPAAAAPPVLGACSLMPKGEVKRHLPWAAMLDQFEPEEDALGNYGSGCEYPSVRVQVMTFSQGTLDQVKKKSGVEAMSGIGDEGYLYHNPNGYAELYVKVGSRALTLQASINSSIDEVRPGVLSLARALVTKLR